MAYRLGLLAVLAVFACGGDNKMTDAPGSGSGSDANGSGASDASGDGTSGVGDANGSGGGPGTTCGNTSCSSTQECCVTGGGGGGTCVTTGTCSGVAFACDGPEDCTNGDVCCFGGGGGGSGGMEGSECKPANQCQLNACHVSTDCGGNTPMCCAVANTPYMVCLAQCPMP